MIGQQSFDPGGYHLASLGVWAGLEWGACLLHVDLAGSVLLIRRNLGHVGDGLALTRTDDHDRKSCRAGQGCGFPSCDRILCQTWLHPVGSAGSLCLRNSGSLARRNLPLQHGKVTADRVQLHRETVPLSTFCGDGACAGAAERLMDQIVGIVERRQYPSTSVTETLPSAIRPPCGG